MSQLYSIVDIETTGGKASRNKITEIAIVLHDGERVLDRWESLINPECYIPYGITQLTGITQEMVEDAPKFYEVAKQVVELTKGAIFVAHNVRFDYNFIREEFARLGYTFSRKQLCTVRMCRKSFPGLRSYSLGNLIQHFGIRVDARHRAMADTMATVELFEKIMKKESGAEDVKSFVNLGIKESLLPKNLTINDIHQLPDHCGVYYFHNEAGDVVYVGKSINIRKRVADHFRNKTEKGRKMQDHVHDVSYELTGSELVALLLESHEIKTLRPLLNRAQRQRYFPYVIHRTQSETGYDCFQIAKPTAPQRRKLDVISEYHKAGHAKGALGRAMRNFELCSKWCHLENGSGACFDFHLKRCLGACVGQESAEDYNERARAAAGRLATVFEDDFFLVDRGRNREERAVVLVENGRYRGYGYLDISDAISCQDDLRACIRPFEGNAETSRIIRRYMGEKVGLKRVKMKGRFALT